MLIYYDKDNTIRRESTGVLHTNILSKMEVVSKDGTSLIGKKVVFGPGDQPKGLRVAVVCNWGDACGIATYSKYLVDAITPYVDKVKLFAEDNGNRAPDDFVDYCWTRGRSMAVVLEKIREWGATLVLIQHEFGIFPRADKWLSFLQGLDNIPYVVTLHSVYQDLDKCICTSAIKNMVVHSATGEACLRKLGNTSNITVIPHGCVVYDDVVANWNIYHTPYTLMQFGFGFNYKGVDTALDAIAMLKESQPAKYDGDDPIFFTYLCSESPHVAKINESYYKSLVAKTKSLGLEDNVAILRGFQTNEVLNQYLRTNKLAIFPYQTDPNNVVFGASGAIRLAMANKVPVIASSSKMFDDIEGVLPRPGTASELACQIDKVFSSNEYRQSLISKATSYVTSHTWDNTAIKYRDLFNRLVNNHNENTVWVGKSPRRCM